MQFDLMKELWKLVCMYEVGDEVFKEKVFPLAVKAILKVMGKDEVLNEVKSSKELYEVIKELTEKYFLLK